MNRTKIAAAIAVPVIALSSMLATAPNAHAASNGWNDPVGWFCKTYNPVFFCR